MDITNMTEQYLKSMNIKELTTEYFRHWNDHNVTKIREMFDNFSYLRNWDILVENRSDIMNVINNTFEKFPEIKYELLMVHESPSTKSCICEFIIHFNSHENIRVVNILEFNNNLKIISLKAFKC